MTGHLHICDAWLGRIGRFEQWRNVQREQADKIPNGFEKALMFYLRKFEQFVEASRQEEAN